MAGLWRNTSVEVARDECEAERRPEQREQQNRDESRCETRAALRGEQNRGAKAHRCRGAKAQRCRGADVQRRKGAKRKTDRVPCNEKEKKNTRRNAGWKRSYIGSARAHGARGDRSHAHTNRDAHLACV